MDIYNIRMFIVWLGGWLVGRQVPVHDVYKHLWEACMRGHLWEACMRGFQTLDDYLPSHYRLFNLQATASANSLPPE
jgi:hypothetical protein